MTEPARTVKFRLYTGREGSSLYVRVRVFNTKAKCWQSCTLSPMDLSGCP